MNHQIPCENATMTQGRTCRECQGRLCGINRFGSLLKHRRIERKITLRKFAIDHGVNAGNLSKIETGLRLPKFQNLDWFFRAYGVPWEALTQAYLADLADILRRNP